MRACICDPPNGQGGPIHRPGGLTLDTVNRPPLPNAFLNTDNYALYCSLQIRIKLALHSMSHILLVSKQILEHHKLCMVKITMFKIEMRNYSTELCLKENQEIMLQDLLHRNPYIANLLTLYMRYDVC